MALAIANPRRVELAPFFLIVCGLRKGTRVAITAILFAGVVQFIHAQNIAQGQSDFNTARSDALLGTSPIGANPPTFGSIVSFGTYPNGNAVPQPPQTPPFNFNLLTPFNYSYSDPNNEASSGVGEAKPELKLGFIVHPSSVPFQFSGFIDEYSDRYAGTHPNSDLLDASLRIDFVGTDPYPARDRFIPYFSYSPQQGFMPFFDKRAILTQDYALGITKLWDFAPDWSRFDSRASFFPTWEVGLQVSGQRRITDSPPDSYGLIISPSIKWAASNAAVFPYIRPEDLGSLAASIGVNVSRRWYDEANGISERAWDVTPVLTIAWGLPSRWFGSAAKYLGSPELDFQAAYFDQISTVAKGFVQAVCRGSRIEGRLGFLRRRSSRFVGLIKILSGY